MVTGYIFRHSGQEANGLALWVLHHFGLMGFAVFKFLMVVFIILVCEAISFHSVERAKQVITGACVLYVLVILWEAFLILAYINQPVLPKKRDTATRPRIEMLYATAVAMTARKL